MTILKYGNTNTVFLKGGLLIDTDYAGTLQAFYRALKMNEIRVTDIKFILATHYHPDHIGLVSELMKQGVKLVLVDTQCDRIHFSDNIFLRENHKGYEPINGSDALVISCGESRGFLESLGIAGEIISTPSHSPDSVSVILDDGCCIVGDLEPYEYLEAYGENDALKKDWEAIMRRAPKRIIYAHANEKKISEL